MESLVNDRIGRNDWVVAASVGVFMTLVLGVFSCSGLDPALWDDAACAHGLVAPQTVFGSVCRLLPGAMTQVGGWLGGGLLAFLLAMIVRAAFVLLVRPAVSSAKGWMLYANVFSACAAILAVCSSPVWQICQALTPTLCQLLGLCGAILLFLRWLTVGRMRRLLPMMAVLGLFAADGPYAFVLLLAGYLAFGLVWKDAVNGSLRLKTHLLDWDELPVWRMLVSFLLPMFLGMALNMKAFASSGGLAAAGWSRKNLLFHYAMSYGSEFVGHRTYMGLAAFLLLGVLPFFVALRVMIRQGYEESKMSFPRGCAVALTGLVALLQILPYPSLWFWRWSVQPAANSVALPLACCFAAVAACFALMCFVADNSESLDHADRIWKGVVPVVLGGLALLGLSGVCQPWTHKMQNLVNEAISATVGEMDSGDWIFTDGVLDRGLELEACRQKRVVWPMNLLAETSPREVFLRNRGLTNATDRIVVQRGAVELLRHWAKAEPSQRKNLAVQLAHDEFSFASNAVPVHGVVASWPNRSDRETADRSAKVSSDLAARALQIASSDALDSAPLSLTQTFYEVMWRLSCQARLRGDADLADRLDAAHRIDRRLRLEYEAKRLRPL